VNYKTEALRRLGKQFRYNDFLS